jgi:succinate dehydrogenase / fumarate reductase membrane anchor subunit
MRYSGLLLIPLAWGHVLIQDVLVGVHRIDLDYVAMRWAMLGWRVFDFLLLAFAFAHGMNGLRQVLNDYILTKMEASNFRCC